MNKNTWIYLFVCLMIPILYVVGDNLYSYFYGVPDMIAVGANISVDLSQTKLKDYQDNKLSSNDLWEIIFSNNDLRSLYEEDAIKPLRFDVVEYQDTLYLRVIHPEYDEGKECVETNEYITSECGILEEEYNGHI